MPNSAKNSANTIVAYLRDELVLADLDMEAVFRMRLHDPRIRRERSADEDKGLRKIDLPDVVRPIRKNHLYLKRIKL
jgi:hypothetical protein